MTNIAAADLANRLPHILEALALGEEFLITEAGQPIARLLAASTPQLEQGLPNEEWQRIFAAWVTRVESRADRYPPDFTVDDSYEAIYGERENPQR